MQATVKQFDLSDLALLWYGGPLAFILVRKNLVKIKKIQPMREFFINEFGVFEVDSETQYRYGKQPISFYNAHDKSIPKKIVKKVNKYYQTGRFMLIKEELAQIYPEIKKESFASIYDLFRFIVIMTDHKAIDIDTEKFLPYYRAYNPISIKKLNEVCHTARKAVDSLHPNLKPPMPMIFAIVGGIIAIAVIQNGPKYARELVAYIEDFGAATRGEPAPEAPAQLILYLQTLLGG